MDKIQVASWNRHLKVRQVRQTNAGLPIPGLVQRVWASHEAKLVAIEALLQAPAGRTTGATLQKSTEEKKAVAAALPLANALYLLYLEDKTDEKASEKAHTLRRNKTDYKALPAALTLAETRNVARQAAALATLLDNEAGLGPDDLKELDDANLAFGQLLAAPLTARSVGKTARTAIETTLKAADKFLESDFRPATKLLKGQFTGLRDALLDAMRIDDAPGAHHPAAEKPTNTNPPD